MYFAKWWGHYIKYHYSLVTKISNSWNWRLCSFDPPILLVKAEDSHRSHLSSHHAQQFSQRRQLTESLSLALEKTLEIKIILGSVGSSMSQYLRAFGPHNSSSLLICSSIPLLCQCRQVKCNGWTKQAEGSRNYALCTIQHATVAMLS